MSADFQPAMKRIVEMADCGHIAFKMNTQKWQKFLDVVVHAFSPNK